jgi:hypothetical protein
MAGRDGGKRLIVPHLLQTTRFSAMLLFPVTCHTSLHPARLTASHRMLFRAGALAFVVARRIQSHRLSSAIWHPLRASKHLLHLSAYYHSSRHVRSRTATIATVGPVRDMPLLRQGEPTSAAPQ